MRVYEFIIKDKSGNNLAILDSANDRTYSFTLNKAGDASFTVNPLDPKITQDLLLLGHKELYIYRYGVLIWGGELGYRSSIVDEKSGKTTVNAKGFYDLLDKKILGSPTVPFSKTNTDLSEIAMDAITEAQTGTNASFGITEGNLATSRNGDRNIDDFKTVKQIIEGVSNTNIQDGIDFEVDANKQFSTYYPQKGSLLSDVVFEWGVNIISFNEIQDSTQMANQIIALGEGQGTEMLTVTEDTTLSWLQPTYKIRQKTISHKDVSIESKLEDNAKKTLSNNKIQQQVLSFKVRGELAPTFGSYEVGDRVKVIIKHGLIDINGIFRIIGIKVKIGDGDSEEIELTVNNT